jgi:hypothetical protein
VRHTTVIVSIATALVGLSLPISAAASSSHARLFDCASNAEPQAEPPADGQQNAENDDQSDSADHSHGGDHMFGVLPNYTTVERMNAAPPLSPALKFKMASLNTFDPFVYPFIGAVAAVNRNYGSGMAGYAKQYAASLADNSIGNFMTTAVLPSLLCQDPRYYERGSGSVLGRVGYAASRIFVTRSDAGHVQFNISEVGGNAVAANLSNLYYPRVDRTIGGTVTRWGMQLMWDTLSNELKEFWPDVRRKLHHR